MLTDQQIFDTVSRHLLEQGEKSKDDQQCLYRCERPDGRLLKCAAGILIKDRFYSPCLEGEGSVEDRVARALFDSGVPVNRDQTSRLVLALQAMHDGCDPCIWTTRLIAIAEKYKLECNFLLDPA